MSKRYGHIDELIRKAEEILQWIGTEGTDGNRYASKTTSSATLFLVKERYRVNDCLSIWVNDERVLWLGKELQQLIFPPKWYKFLNDFHAEAMAQVEADAALHRLPLDMDDLPGMFEKGDFMGGLEVKR